MTQGRRVLVFSPVFHEYWRSIAGGFTEIGHDVQVHCFDEHLTPLSKARNKVVFEGLDRIRPGAGTARFIRAATHGARQALRRVRPDAVVVVKGDLLGDAFWDDLSRAGIPHVLWLYDELRRTHHDLDRLRELGAVASYSPIDVGEMLAAGISARHVPLAFDPTFVHARIPVPGVVFIGARYPGRTALLTELGRHGVPVQAVGNEWSHRVIDRLRTLEWFRPDVPARPSVDRSIGAGMMAGALATLNIHGDQDGFTMRTFEASGVGALQLIDRDDVGLHYEPGSEVLTFSCVDEVIDIVDRIRIEPAWAARIRSAARARTIAEHTFAHRARDLEAMWG